MRAVDDPHALYDKLLAAGNGTAFAFSDEEEGGAIAESVRGLAQRVKDRWNKARAIALTGGADLEAASESAGEFLAKRLDISWRPGTLSTLEKDLGWRQAHAHISDKIADERLSTCLVLMHLINRANERATRSVRQMIACDTFLFATRQEWDLQTSDIVVILTRFCKRHCPIDDMRAFWEERENREFLHCFLNSMHIHLVEVVMGAATLDQTIDALRLACLSLKKRGRTNHDLETILSLTEPMLQRRRPIEASDA